MNANTVATVSVVYGPVRQPVVKTTEFRRLENAKRQAQLKKAAKHRR